MAKGGTAPTPFAAVEKFRRSRKYDEVPQHEAARRLGISPAYLSLIERGLRPCPPAIATRLFEILAERSS